MNVLIFRQASGLVQIARALIEPRFAVQNNRTLIAGRHLHFDLCTFQLAGAALSIATNKALRSLTTPRVFLVINRNFGKKLEPETSGRCIEENSRSHEMQLLRIEGQRLRGDLAGGSPAVFPYPSLSVLNCRSGATFFSRADGISVRRAGTSFDAGVEPYFHLALDPADGFAAQRYLVRELSFRDPRIERGSAQFGHREHGTDAKYSPPGSFTVL